MLRKIFYFLLFASNFLWADAVSETGLWLKEREQFTPHSCRLATRRDVREFSKNELGDVILKGVRDGGDTPFEMPMGHYVRLRESEAASDTLNSRLTRLGFSLVHVPTKSCKLWDEYIKTRAPQLKPR